LDVFFNHLQVFVFSGFDLELLQRCFVCEQLIYFFYSGDIGEFLCCGRSGRNGFNVVGVVFSIDGGDF
jgi:hypothetical protein